MVSVMDGFRRYAHARVITDFKNMADYMKSERHWLKASEKAKTKTRTTATRLQETPEKRQMLEKDREARRNDSGLTQSKFVDILFALIKQ